MTKVYYIWLLLVFGDNSTAIPPLLKRFGTAEKAYSAIRNNSAAIGRAYAEKAASTTLEEAEDILRVLNEQGVETIPIGSRLYPKALMRIENPPCVLFAKGNTDALTKRLLTVVGSRAITSGTYEIQTRTLEKLFKRFVPVTTMSDGCDELTCLTAIRCKVPCIAVMPCGLDKLYPKNAFVLREELLHNGGCLITEHLPQTPPTQGNFLKRGRILGGISKAALIMQAGAGSGALVTAQHSPAPFFIPPPDIFDKDYAGAATAVRSGANVYFGIDDIEKAFADDYEPQRLKIKRRTKQNNPEAPEAEKEKAAEAAVENAAEPISEKPAKKAAKSSKKPVSKKVSVKKSAAKKPEPSKTQAEAPADLGDKRPRKDFDTDEHYAVYSAVFESGGSLSFDEIKYRTEIELDRLCEVLLDLEIDGIFTVFAGNRYQLS